MSSPGAPRSGAEIQAALGAFVQRWRDYAGTEISEATAEAEQLFSDVGEHDDCGYLDLVDLMLWAERTGVVDARDLSMLVEYYYAREFTGAGHDHVARRFGVTVRTSKRRCTAALAALQQAAPQYLAG